MGALLQQEKIMISGLDEINTRGAVLQGDT